MATSAEDGLELFKAKTKKEAEKVVRNLFPEKVIALNDLLESEKFSMKRLTQVNSKINVPVPEPSSANHNSSEPARKKRRSDSTSNDTAVTGTPVYSLPGGSVFCNEHIVEMVDAVKPLICDLIDQANLVKMWITFMIPRIEDGNNFGVSIQEDTMAEARTVETEAATYLDQISRYFMTRGKIISKIAKYPHVEDYRRTVSELDEKEFLALRLVVCELRNQYASLHDIITKNLEKIQKPRSCNTDNMY